MVNDSLGMANAEIIGVPKIFGEVLRRYRTDCGVTQEELAFRAGVDRTFIYRLERGIRQPTITTIIGLALALGVPASELVGETEARYRKSSNAPRKRLHT
jgi:transcriptional regulator with XRE-family HTH domain